MRKTAKPIDVPDKVPAAAKKHAAKKLGRLYREWVAAGRPVRRRGA